MEIIDNINHLLGENLKRTIKSNAKLKIETKLVLDDSAQNHRL